MDKSAIKKYAVWARRELISRVSQKALQYGITDRGYGEKDTDSVNGVLLSATEKSQRKALIQKIIGFADYKNGYEQVIEEVAYTWFNRFTALRFMEVNGYLPTHIRVFTDDNNAFKPQILTEALHMDLFGLDKSKVLALKQANNDAELYKYLLISQCNALGGVLPGMFQKISNYTELLFPDNLLREGSVIGRMIVEIPERDWNVGEEGQVEIIGWLYQYYISEKHDEVVDPLHGKIVKKEDVPAATQLFTTDWVVRYITDNSVGRYWIERNPESALAGELQYFIKPKNGISYVNEIIEPKELTVFDPCVGSGHFLIYAFEVLIKIYNECGYSTKDAVSSIVRNNIYGLDIDERATQLAYFAVMMKAVSYDSRFLTRGIQPNIYAIEESNKIDSDLLEYFCGGSDVIKQDIMSVISDMSDAKEYGSIINVKSVNFNTLYSRFDEIIDDSHFLSYKVWHDLLPIVKVAEILSKKYKTVITNPPYLNKYSTKLKMYIETNYEDYKGDLFSVFMYRNLEFCDLDGYSGFMTPNVWMFIKTYEKLRKYLIHEKHISSLIQMAKGAFFKEATVDVCAFVLCNHKQPDRGLYIRLEDFKGDMEVQNQKVLEALQLNECDYLYSPDEFNFAKIPGNPIAYWASEKMLNTFIGNNSFSGVTKKGVLTGNNERFLRYWHEVSIAKVTFNFTSYADMQRVDYKWLPITSGGLKRKWYGNFDTIVNLSNEGEEIKRTVQNYRLRDPEYYFREAITWTEVSSGIFSCRYVPSGILFGNGGPVAFFYNNKLKYTLGFLNSNIVLNIMAYLAPTVNYGPEQIEKLPILVENEDMVNTLIDDNISISKTDWDSFETSWDFKKHPLI